MSALRVGLKLRLWSSPRVLHAALASSRLLKCQASALRVVPASLASTRTLQINLQVVRFE